MENAAVTYSNMTSTSLTASDWIGFYGASTPTPAYCAASNSNGNVTLSFETPNTPIALNSDETDAGRIRVYWGHTAYGKILKLKVNGGSEVSLEPTGVNTAFFAKMAMIAEYTIPKGTEAINTLNFASASNAGFTIFRVEILTHASSTPTCEDAPTVSSITKGATTATTQVMNCAGISSLGSEGCTISSYGFVYGTSANPTISDTKVEVGTTYTTTSTAFATTTLTGLTPSTTYHVRAYATNGAGTAYSSDATFTTSVSVGNVTYIAGAADATTDAIKALRDANYVVTVRTKAASPDYTGVDLVVLDESLSWANSDEGGSVIAADVPILNLKAFFYTLSNRWNWGTPVNPSPKSELATLSTEYSNVSSHPIFDGVTISEGAVDMIGTAKDGNNLQGVTTSTLVSGKEGYTLATSASGTTCIHELTPAQRGVTNSKYLLIALSNNVKDNYSADAKKMILNAAAYLIDNSEQWEPAAPSCAATAEAGADKSTTVGEGVAMAATAATSGYTGAWSIKAGSPSTDAGQLGTTSSNTMTFTPNTTGTYTLVWTVTDDNDNTCYATSEATVTVTAPTHSVSAITSTGNNTYGSVSAASATVAEGSTVLITAVPATGYRVANWAVSGTGATISPSGASNSNTTTLTMGTANATVTVTFEEIPCPTSGTVYSSVTTATEKISIAESASNLELNSSTHKTTVSGGKMYVYNGQTSDKDLITSDGFALTNGNTYFHIQLDCALEAGDTISVKVGKNADERGVWISSTRTDNVPSSAPACALTTTETGSELKAVTYTVTGSDEYHGKKDFYIYRATSNGTYFNNVKITRPAKYAMTFAKGDEGADGTMDAQSVIERSLVTLPACTFTAPEGKEFDAWDVTKTAGGAAVTVTDGKFTMPQEAVTLTATWKTLVVKYAVTYVLNGPDGDAPTETNKAEDEAFDLAAAPTWSGHVFQGWQWIDNSSVTHLEDAAASFTMPAYAVTFTAQWKLDPNASMADAKYVIGGSALNMAAKYESSNTESSVSFSLKEDYGDDASITSVGSFTATAAGEYIVVANQESNATYAKGEAEATVEVLESELSDIFIFSKKSDYGGSGKCLSADQANTDDGEHLYTSVSYEGFTKMGRATTNNTECILTFSVKNAYNSLFAIKSICTYGKFEEPAGGQISWDGGTNWEDLAKYTSEGKKEFAPAAGAYPTSFKIKFMGVSKDAGGLWWRNALVTLEAKKAIVSTVIDLTDVKINGTSISAANLATLKTADAYALVLTDEYVTAPTLKFNKHTVITYEDDSQVEKDDVISKTAAVNGSDKWEASAEINEITYTVTMAKADAFIVHYYQADGETLIGSENVAVSGHPTAAGITPTPQDYKRVVWTLSDEPVDLEDVTSDVAGTEINLVASYVTAYASSINIEQWVLNNKVANKDGFIAELEGKGYKQVDLNALDSLNDDPSKTNRNYAFLGMKVNKSTSAISFLLKNGSTVKARFGNMGSSVNVTIGEAEPVELTSGSYANTAVNETKEYSYTAEADVIVKFQSTDTKTVVFKQIMIDEEIQNVILPAIVTLDANGGTYADESVKYTGTPLVIGNATPASDDYLFEGWHVGTVEGAKINAAAYEPTANVTLVAKYVLKPSPFSLSELTFTIGDGEAQEVGYVEGTYEYDVELPYAGTYETITVAYTLAEGTSSVKAGAVLDVTSVPGAATFTVIAANETEKTYTVNFKKEAKDGLSIIKATISGGDESTGFDATGLYAGKGYANTSAKKLNTNNYIGVQLKAGQSFQAGDKLYVVTTTDADRGYIELYQEAAGTNLVKALGVRDASAGIELPSEAYGLNELYIVRKTSDGDQSWNGTVNYVEVTRPMNPVLKSITFDSNKIDVTGTTVAETLPYATDLTAVTAEYFWNGAGTAVVTTNEGAWAWGENTYVLTDKDGDATTYTISLTRAERSTDATLSSLTVNGNAMELVADKYEYTYEYPYGTDPATVPVVAAEANDAHKHSMDITQATNATGTAEIVVVAEDETTTLTYTVRFCISRNQTLVIYDGKESEPMNAIANPGSLEPGLEWTIKDPNSTSASSADAVVFEGKSYKKYVQLFTSATKAPNEGNTRYMTITVPENYLAKFRLVGCGNGSGDRSLFISKEITGTLDESIAFVHTTSATITGMTSDYQYPGTYYLCCDASIRIYELSVTLYPIDYSREVTQNIYGTICLPNGGIMVGATIFEVAHMTYENNQPYKVFFDEVIDGVMEAGMPYIFLPKDDVTSIAVTYTDEANAAAGNHNGLYGTLSLMNGDDLLGKYIFYNNSLFASENPANWLNANRAYIKLSEVPDYVTPVAQGRRRVAMGFNGTNTATGFDQVTSGQVLSTKLLIDGQMYILRGEKMFDATGRLVK